MKIAVCSDLHLEFGPIELTNDESVDVLVLSGDICVAKDLGDRDTYNTMGEHTKSFKYHKFFQECSANFPYVIYIMGNHEHYHGDYANTHKHICEHLGYLKNLLVLDKEVVEIDNVTFIGGTLWTDMNKEDPLTLHSMASMMNDFRCVDNSNRTVTRRVPLYKKDANGNHVMNRETNSYIEEGFKMKQTPARFSPEDAVEDHKNFLEYIRIVTEGKFDQKFVVCGHHAPSRLSTHPRYKNQEMMNGGYSSSLDEFIMDRPQIKLWTHGHTHEDFDYMVGDTRVVCNPRGYIGYEERADEFKLKTFEI